MPINNGQIFTNINVTDYISNGPGIINANFAKIVSTTEVSAGLAQIATLTEVLAVTEAAKHVTPATLNGYIKAVSGNWAAEIIDTIGVPTIPVSASQAEVNAGLINDKFVVPQTLRPYAASLSATILNSISIPVSASQAETNAGSINTKYVTPQTLYNFYINTISVKYDSGWLIGFDDAYTTAGTPKFNWTNTGYYTNQTGLYNSDPNNGWLFNLTTGCSFPSTAVDGIFTIQFRYNGHYLDRTSTLHTNDIVVLNPAIHTSVGDEATGISCFFRNSISKWYMVCPRDYFTYFDNTAAFRGSSARGDFRIILKTV